jgi:hypothetical protein
MPHLSVVIKLEEKLPDQQEDLQLLIGALKEGIDHLLGEITESGVVVAISGQTNPDRVYAAFHGKDLPRGAE